MNRQLTAVVAATLVLTGPAAAGSPSPLKKKLDAAAALSIFTDHSPDSLAGSLRGFLVKNLSPILYESRPGWGEVEWVKRIEWDGLRPEKVYKPKKDGTWQHIRLTAENLADTLILDVRNLQAAPGKITFQVYLSFDARIYHLVQKWHKGLKLYDGHTQARFRVKLLMCCKATCKLDKDGGLLPDAIFRLRVTQSDLSYDNFVVEHIAGVGGEAAQLIGDAVRGGMRKFNPELEQNLLAKGEAAIVKAADTKQVRVSLSKLLTK